MSFIRNGASQGVPQARGIPPAQAIVFECECGNPKLSRRPISYIVYDRIDPSRAELVVAEELVCSKCVAPLVMGEALGERIKAHLAKRLLKENP